MKITYLFIVLILSLSIITALPNDANNRIDFTYSKSSSTNYSLVNVNNSQYLQGYTWLTNPYFNIWSSTFNSTYNTWLGNYSLYSPFWYNMTSTSSGTYNSTYDKWSYNQTIPALNYKNWINYNASTLNTTGFSYNVQTMSAFSEGLVSWWRMDDLNASGGVVDYVGRNNGTNKGIVQTDAGKFGKGINFNGSSASYVNFGNPSNFNFETNDFSVSAWFYAFSMGGTGEIVHKGCGCNGCGSGFRLAYHYTAGVDFVICNQSGGYNAIGWYSASGGAWHHLVGVRNGTNIYHYLDGVQVKSKAIPSTLNISGGLNAYLGARSDGGGAPFNGTIDDVMIFNRSLTASEIKALYDSSIYSLYKNETNLNQSNNYTMYAQDINALVIDCIDNQCPEEIVTTGENASLDFNDTVIHAKDFVMNSRIYSGDAISLIKGIKVKPNINNGFQEVDYKTSSKDIQGKLSISTILKAIMQIITKQEDLESEDNKIKDCTSKSKDWNEYKLCIGKL